MHAALKVCTTLSADLYQLYWTCKEPHGDEDNNDNYIKKYWIMQSKAQCAHCIKKTVYMFNAKVLFNKSIVISHNINLQLFW